MKSISELLDEVQTLQSVYCEEEKDFKSDHWLYKKVGFVFGKYTLAFECDANTDELIINVVSTCDFESNTNIFNRYIGKKLVNIWISTNSNGYQDLVHLGFEYFEPQIGLYSSGSTISIMECYFRKEHII
jgi:hypothetical protein